MKIKETLMAAAIGLLALSAVQATELADIIQGAKDKSPAYKNSVITYQNGLLNLQKMDLEDQIGITVQGTVNPLVSGYGEDKYGISVAPSVTVQLPNNGKTTITGSMSYANAYEDNFRSIAGGVGVSHTIDFTGYKTDKAEDLNYTRSKYNTELTFKVADLSFEQSVITNVITLLTAEKNMVQNEAELTKLRKNLSDMDTLGTFSVSSSSHKQLENSIKKWEDTLTAANQQLEDARYNYTVLTGLEWDYLDPLPEPVLNLTTYENGNTQVAIKLLQAESAAETYVAALAESNPNAMTLEAAVEASNMNYNPKSLIPLDTTGWTASGSATYTASNWSVSVAPSFSYTKIANKSNTTPGLTIKGSWTNTSKESNDLELQRLMNTAQSNQNDYITSLTNYTMQAQSYAVSIMNWNYRKAQAEANMDYLEMVLENQRSLFELGLAKATDVADAELSIYQAKYDWDIMILEGLSLQRDLEVFAL